MREHEYREVNIGKWKSCSRQRYGDSCTNTRVPCEAIRFVGSRGLISLCKQSLKVPNSSMAIIINSEIWYLLSPFVRLSSTNFIFYGASFIVYTQANNRFRSDESNSFLEENKIVYIELHEYLNTLYNVNFEDFTALRALEQLINVRINLWKVFNLNLNIS